MNAVSLSIAHTPYASSHSSKKPANISTPPVEKAQSTIVLNQQPFRTWTENGQTFVEGRTLSANQAVLAYLHSENLEQSLHGPQIVGIDVYA